MQAESSRAVEKSNGRAPGGNPVYDELTLATRAAGAVTESPVAAGTVRSKVCVRMRCSSPVLNICYIYITDNMTANHCVAPRNYLYKITGCRWAG